MSRIYDNWERLVRATLRREDLRLTSQLTPSDLSLASLSSFSFSAFPSRVPSFNFSCLLVGFSYTYHQILQATEYLSDFNLIKHGHAGDIFYGVLEGGIQVVVKKIDLSSSVLKESYSFITELEIHHKVSHSRVVPLLGHCLENMNDKFLVYKYMPNKDLSAYLYGQNNSVADDDDDFHRLRVPYLDWITRLKIAIGAAESLCYLHHECVPPIVHRDIQASSILLDDNFEVRLGSLGESCPATENDSSKNSIARLLRLPKRTGQDTSGTSNHATCAHDVYCFGKVLLQLVTGKLHLSAAKNWKDLTLHIYDKELVRKDLDPSLIMEDDVFMEVWAVAIVARACLDPKPSRRPQMAQVLKALRKGKITDSAYFEMARTIKSYRTFLSPISPKF